MSKRALAKKNVFQSQIQAVSLKLYINFKNRQYFYFLSRAKNIAKTCLISLLLIIYIIMWY